MKPTSRFCARSTASRKINIKDAKLLWNVDDNLVGLKLSHAINNKAGEAVVPQGRKITAGLMREIVKNKIAPGRSGRRTIWKAPSSPPTSSICRPAK